MSSLIPFEFETKTIRVIQDEQGEPWFVAADVCAVLDITETHRALSRLDDDEKGRHSMTTPGGPQELSIINESGLYSLVLTSRKPEAKRFKKWITAEVIPSIRKTGTYSVSSQSGSSATDLAIAKSLESVAMFAAATRDELKSLADTTREELKSLADTTFENTDKVEALTEVVSRQSMEITQLRIMTQSRRRLPASNDRQFGLALDPLAKPRRESQGGTHASPREHYRRGHYRQLADGRVVEVKGHMVKQNKKEETLQ